MKVLGEANEETVTREEIAVRLKSDPSYNQLVTYVIDGWPSDAKKVPEHLRRFYNVRDGLDTDEGCLYYADRIFIPSCLRELVLKQLHDQHFGIVRCKQLARKYVWWPGIDQDIEEFIQRCDVCQKCSVRRRQHPLMSWEKSMHPFERVHLDHFFFDGKKFLIIVDSFSNWIHVDFNKFVDTECVILSLRKFFSVFGLPKIIVTDNGTAFVSNLFENFCKVNGIIHKTTPQYHPESNGLAERSVGIVKANLKKYLIDQKSKSLSLEAQIQNFLFKYHATPLTDGSSPADKVLCFKVRTLFSQLQKSPSTTSKAQMTRDPPRSSLHVAKTERESSKELKNEKEKVKRNEVCMPGLNKNEVKNKVFCKNDLVYVYWPRASTKFVDGVVRSQLSPLTYEVELSNGHKLKVHRDSLKPRVGKGFVPSFQVPCSSFGSRESSEHDPYHLAAPSTSAATTENTSVTSRNLRQRPRINYKQMMNR